MHLKVWVSETKAVVYITFWEGPPHRITETESLGVESQNCIFWKTPGLLWCIAGFKNYASKSSEKKEVIHEVLGKKLQKSDRGSVLEGLQMKEMK